MKCLFCETENINFKCEKCQSGFCVNHSATTEQWECKKHILQYSKPEAIDSKYKCSVLEESTCPECGSQLKVQKLSSGQFYLGCTKCTWNSYSNSPGLFDHSEAKLAKEANRYGLDKGWKVCDKKLKHTTGKDICPNCFIELLKRAPATNFTTIMNSFNITAEQMVRLIKTYLEEERIYGIIDSKNQCSIISLMKCEINWSKKFKRKELSRYRIWV